MLHPKPSGDGFLSIQAQDFIEERVIALRLSSVAKFLSIQAQDFIEETTCHTGGVRQAIPEHSSSGLH